MRAQYLHGVKLHFVNKLCNSGIKDGKNIFYMQSFKFGDDHVAAIQRKCLFIIISKDKLAADKTIQKLFWRTVQFYRCYLLEILRMKRNMVWSRINMVFANIGPL